MGTVVRRGASDLPSRARPPYMSRVLLIAPGGMLGRAWARLLDRRGGDYEPAGRDVIDLSDLSSIEDGVRLEHSVVVNCGAWTDVDGAEARRPACSRDQLARPA